MKLRFSMEARTAISAYVEELPGGRELSRREISAYSERTFSYGWEVPFYFPDKIRRLHILIADTFPFSVARIALVYRPDFLTWPHVEEDGLLCLHSDLATWDLKDPVAVVRKLLEWATELVKACVLGTNQSDFIDEFNSYWNWATRDGVKKELKAFLR